MNGRGGYIKLFRKIMEKGFYKKPDFLALWVHLLLRANHKGIAVFWNGEEKIIERGQFITSRPKLAQETGIEDSKIERILKFFKSEHMIEQQSFSKFRLITILNYDEWQGDEQENEQQVNSKRTADEQQVNTNKNDNNEKNPKNIITPVAEKPRRGRTYRISLNYESREWEGITEKDILFWTETYPAIDIKSALKETLSYWIEHPKNKRKNWGATIISRLSILQERAKPGGKSNDRGGYEKSDGATLTEVVKEKYRREAEAREKQNV